MATHKVIATLTDPNSGKGVNVSAVMFSPDGSRLADADDVGIYIWNVVSHKNAADLQDQNGDYTDVAFSPDGNIIAAGNGDGSIELYNANTKDLLNTLTDPNGANVTSVAFSHGGNVLAAADWTDDSQGGGPGNFYLWNIIDHKLITKFTDPDGGGVDGVAFSPLGNIVAAADVNKGTTYLWNPATRKLIGALNDPNGDSVRSVAFSPNGHVLAAGDGDGSTYLWNVATGQLVATLSNPNSNGITAVSFNAPGSILATADFNGSICLWNVTKYVS
jgi:WD40 repeat protein